MSDMTLNRTNMLKVVTINGVALLAILVAFEVGVRWSISYNPSYYVGAKAVGSCIPHPYGEVCLNSYGYPDEEFDLASSKPRVGYFGDSVCYGVGAGKGYRLTDRLKAQYAGYAHFNYCYIGDDPLAESTRLKMLRLVEEFKLSHVVYLMNLNDIPPLMAEMARVQGTAVNQDSQRDRFAMATIKRVMTPIDEILRGRSFLYTFVRNKIKERLTVAGYGHDGYQTVEQFPSSNQAVFAYASGKINGLAEELRARGVQMSVVLLPYEMQISSDAAATYRRLRIQWEPEFEQGSAQRLLAANLDPKIRVFDAIHAFEGHRDKAKVGDLFVFDKGDKIDWNHPNREGHRLIAEYLSTQGFLPHL